MEPRKFLEIVFSIAGLFRQRLAIFFSLIILHTLLFPCYFHNKIANCFAPKLAYLAVYKLAYCVARKLAYYAKIINYQ